MDTKSCTGCGETKPLGEFYEDRGRPTSRCKECILKDRKAKQSQANATRRKRHQQRVDEGDYVTPEFKQCNGKCKRTLPIAEFHNSRGAADGKQAKCKQCVSDYQKANREERSAYSREWRKKGGAEQKLKERGYHLKRKFGLTLEQFDAMLAAQDGRCGACPATEPGSTNWHVDHDHACCPDKDKTCGNCIRSILCARCNQVLGMVQEDQSVLYYLIQYIARNQNITPEREDQCPNTAPSRR